ncbi:hypothetical protein [Tritonibacter horizontis]|uniref:Uncharacterized protein n=1 Tax=Tritonibacter horizontis TaxID=1768241 RepID=A0A132BZQ3_9RHOB|nr:hypothetical protein [Tritonibacter horizontis]KUP93794.1 hypothetical protein TRIHO_12860 [Tritonibacter horizontis]
MSEADTPMTTRREVRQRKRGLYWAVAILGLAVLGLALFGFADELIDEDRPAVSLEAPLADGIEGGVGAGD